MKTVPIGDVDLHNRLMMKMTEKPEDEMTPEEREEKRKEITLCWLTGQEQVKKKFNKEAYEKIQREKQLEELQEEAESYAESLEGEKSGGKKEK